MTKTKQEWGVRHSEGEIEVIDPASANEAYMSPEQAARVRAQAIGGEVITRTKRTASTGWAKPGQDSWVEWCRDVLDEVLVERGKQVAQYGLNDECEDGMGSKAEWLKNTAVNLDLRNATEIEAVFRVEYERYSKRHGKPTWMHLIREELAETFAEDDILKREHEAIQTAALLVSYVEFSRRRRRG